MERLTERWCKGMVRIKGCSTAYPDKERKGAPAANAIVRLADYEDTGMTPKQVRLISNVLQEVGETYNCWFDYVVNCVLENSHLKELAQAEKDGRLVVLPCKVGDKVYRVITTLNSTPVITEIEIKTLGQAVDLIGRIGEKRLLVSWYLTREEAEAALKKREADNEAD